LGWAKELGLEFWIGYSLGKDWTGLLRRLAAKGVGRGNWKEENLAGLEG